MSETSGSPQNRTQELIEFVVNSMQQAKGDDDSLRAVATQVVSELSAETSSEIAAEAAAETAAEMHAENAAEAAGETAAEAAAETAAEAAMEFSGPGQTGGKA